jgi:hypothetical protein
MWGAFVHFEHVEEYIYIDRNKECATVYIVKVTDLIIWFKVVAGRINSMQYSHFHSRNQCSIDFCLSAYKNSSKCIYSLAILIYRFPINRKGIKLQNIILLVYLYVTLQRMHYRYNVDCRFYCPIIYIIFYVSKYYC